MTDATVLFAVFFGCQGSCCPPDRLLTNWITLIKILTFAIIALRQLAAQIWIPLHFPHPFSTILTFSSFNAIASFVLVTSSPSIFASPAPLPFRLLASSMTETCICATRASPLAPGLCNSSARRWLRSRTAMALFCVSAKAIWASWKSECVVLAGVGVCVLRVWRVCRLRRC